MSALPPEADIGTQSRNVRFVPIADILTAGCGPGTPSSRCGDRLGSQINLME